VNIEKWKNALSRMIFRGLFLWVGIAACLDLVHVRSSSIPDFLMQALLLFVAFHAAALIIAVRLGYGYFDMPAGWGNSKNAFGERSEILWLCLLVFLSILVCSVFANLTPSVAGDEAFFLPDRGVPSARGFFFFAAVLACVYILWGISGDRRRRIGFPSMAVALRAAAVTSATSCFIRVSTIVGYCCDGGVWHDYANGFPFHFLQMEEMSNGLRFSPVDLALNTVFWIILAIFLWGLRSLFIRGKPGKVVCAG
jgi:hypothetical protein